MNGSIPYIFCGIEVEVPIIRLDNCRIGQTVVYYGVVVVVILSGVAAAGISFELQENISREINIDRRMYCMII